MNKTLRVVVMWVSVPMNYVWYLRATYRYYVNEFIVKSIINFIEYACGLQHAFAHPMGVSVSAIWYNLLTIL